MAYSELQKKDIAKEIARSGGNLAAACRHLRDDYESFREIGESTLRRLMKADGFALIVAAQGELLAAAREEAVKLAEQRRAQRNAENVIASRLQRDEAIFDSVCDLARKALDTAIKSPDAVKLGDAIRAMTDCMRIADRRREVLTIIQGTTEESVALVESVKETIVSKYPKEAGEVIDAMRERFNEKMAANKLAREKAAAEKERAAASPEAAK